MNALQVIQTLKENGWILKSQKGSHRQFVHPKKSGKITVAFHGKRTYHLEL
jgi:predicted RNA binding protein YcfA (HicA-like mRNA interferase family)